MDEKCDKMLQIFYDSQDFFLLKELEKSGPKKGVISQSVKDVIQSLVDDDLVFKDKIGTSVTRCFHIQLCIVDDDQFSSVIRGNILKAAESALNLEQGRLQQLKQSDDENQALKLCSIEVCWHPNIKP
ncbi:hypothetical protein ACE6H2_026788 [Prunus campanulata]